MTLKCGDLVRIKSGGPKMCVEGGTSDTDITVSCVWINYHTGNVERHVFHRGTLSLCRDETVEVHDAR